MTNINKLISKLAVAIGLIGSVAFATVTPSVARHTAASVYTMYPVHHRGGGAVDDPPGSLFQDQGNNESMGFRG